MSETPDQDPQAPAPGEWRAEDDPPTMGESVVAAKPSPVAPPPADVVEQDKTWSGGTATTETADVIEAQQDRKHQRRMQTWVIAGIGGLILAVLLLVFFVQKGPVSEAFSERIADLMLPALLASGGTVVGFYFRHDGK